MLNASYARLVAIVDNAVDNAVENESWAIGGIRSPEHWLKMRAGLSPFHARQIVAIARRRGELPTVMGEFGKGQLSLDQVAVIARYAPAHVEASVAELAVHASVPQLRRALSQYSFDPPAPNGYAPTNTTFPDPHGEAPNSQPTSNETTGGPAGESAPNDSAPNDSTTNGKAAGTDSPAASAVICEPTLNDVANHLLRPYAGAQDRR